MQIAVMIFLFSGAFQAQTQKQVGVCEVLRNLESYAGKLITIHAVVLGGTRHGYYLADSSQEAPCYSMPNDKTDWSPTIYLVWPSSRGVTGGSPPFERDKTAEEKFNAVIRQAQKSSGRLVTATLVGQIRTRRALRLFHDKKENIYFGNGYGEGGMHPAQFVIKTITAMDIE
jgi:hypothetical protein